MKYLTLTLSKEISEEGAVRALKGRGYAILFTSWGREREIACSQERGWQELRELPWITSIEETSYAGIDWEEQWQLHGPPSSHGECSVELVEYGLPKGRITLSSGPGFGDLSHPTTRLMLAMMAERLEEAFVVDIGCGSGVLSLAALAAGARRAVAIDIDGEALEHTKKNSALNGMGHRIDCFLPESCPPVGEEGALLLMNMIHSEQRSAFAAMEKKLLKGSYSLITSGILLKERGGYLSEAKSRGWLLQEERHEGQWCAFRFLTTRGQERDG